MPEAPDLKVIVDFLNKRAKGLAVESARVVKPSVVRPLAGDVTKDIPGRTLEGFERRGKFVLAPLFGGRMLAINPMLTGLFQWCPSTNKPFKRTCLILTLSGGHDLRYLDDKQMRMVYYCRPEQVADIPKFKDGVPDVLDGVNYEEFKQRLRPFRGEIKGVLTRGDFITGIGNAYADELLFEARIYPFKKSTRLSDEELRRLHGAMKPVMEWAIKELEGRVGEDIHEKIRDFLKVHNKGGQPCPRCGNPISELTANQRITSYCRRCQPGLLIRN
jgi:formamidopyrimidine-DNA glycosylase